MATQPNPAKFASFEISATSAGPVTPDSHAHNQVPDWLSALPQCAAIIDYCDGQMSVHAANAMFVDKLPERSIGGFWSETQADGVPDEWFSRVSAFVHNARMFTESFEMRRDTGVGPEHYTCNLGRLNDGPEGQVRILLTAIDRTSERLAEKNLRRELLSDSLTALPNRVGFGELVEERLAQPDGFNKSGFAILAVDLVRFSRINESLGALAGDELIITVARRLKSSLRQGDILARIGGNEFAIFARLNNGLADALYIVQRINDALANPCRLSNLQISVDCAIGCAIAGPEDDDADTIVRQAQAAVKLAKRSGKLEIYRPGVLSEAHRRFNLESRLRDALDRGGLELAFQPLMNLQTREVTGFEALARWHDPELGNVHPAEFIPVAEESGLIVPLGRWAMHEAAQTLARWDRQHGSALPIGVNVNVSPIQMARDDVPTVMEEALRYAGIAGCRITVEMTESTIIADPDRARHVLSALKSLYVRIAMDDFGTGYSNLASLQSLPIDVLKIDRSFVLGMTADNDKGAIIRAILSLSESLGLSTTAEGVETAEVALILTDLGCSHGQGYYFAPPMSGQDAYKFWAARRHAVTI